MTHLVRKLGDLGRMRHETKKVVLLLVLVASRGHVPLFSGSACRLVFAPAIDWRMGFRRGLM
jgi:hypothetical protein